MEHKISITAKLILLAAMIYAVISLIVITGDLRAAETERDRLVAEVEQLDERLRLLDCALISQSTPETTENFARNELGMVWSGETIFCYKRSAPTG